MSTEAMSSDSYVFASLARVAGGGLGWFVIAFHNKLFSSESSLEAWNVIIATTWLIGAFVGGNLPAIWSLIKYHAYRPWEWRPTWTLSVGVALSCGALTTFVSPAEIPWRPALLAFAVATNVLYAFAKLGCKFIGCCTSHRYGGFFEWVNRAGLASIEAGLSIVIIAVVLTAVDWCGYTLAAVIGFSLHALLRGVSGWSRFPDRTFFSFVTDPSVGLLAMLSASAGILLEW